MLAPVVLEDTLLGPGVVLLADGTDGALAGALHVRARRLVEQRFHHDAGCEEDRGGEVLRGDPRGERTAGVGGWCRADGRRGGLRHLRGGGGCAMRAQDGRGELRDGQSLGSGQGGGGGGRGADANDATGGWGGADGAAGMHRGAAQHRAVRARREGGGDGLHHARPKVCATRSRVSAVTWRMDLIRSANHVAPARGANGVNSAPSIGNSDRSNHGFEAAKRITTDRKRDRDRSSPLITSQHSLAKIPSREAGWSPSSLRSWREPERETLVGVRLIRHTKFRALARPPPRSPRSFTPLSSYRRRCP